MYLLFPQTATITNLFESFFDLDKFCQTFTNDYFQSYYLIFWSFTNILIILWHQLTKICLTWILKQSALDNKDGNLFWWWHFTLFCRQARGYLKIAFVLTYMSKMSSTLKQAHFLWNIICFQSYVSHYKLSDNILILRADLILEAYGVHFFKQPLRTCKVDGALSHTCLLKERNCL